MAVEDLDRIKRAEEIQRYTENRCEALEKENAELREKWLQATDEGTSWARLKYLENTNEELKQEKAQYIELLKEWKTLVCNHILNGCCPSCEKCLFGKLKKETDNILRTEKDLEEILQDETLQKEILQQEELLLEELKELE